MPTVLVVMARSPQIGEGKTRLARTIGTAQAYRLYGAFLQDIATRFSGGRRALVWAFYPPETDFSALSGVPSRCLPQEGRDFGERMWNCFRTLCAEGFDRVLMIGADVPHVRDEWLDEAEVKLETNDLVLGPTEDGGYYLVAMRTPHDVFTGVPMSTERVLSETLRKARADALRVHLLPRSFDIDQEGDLQRLQWILRTKEYGVQLPHTAAVLATVYRDVAAK